MSRVEVAAVMSAALGEGPVWDEQRQVLHLVDILAGRIHQFDPRTGGLTSLDVDGAPGALALRTDGGYIAGIDRDLATLSPDGTRRTVATVSTGQRFNDGKCDPRGRFLAGTMDPERPGTSALYSLDVDGTVTQLLDGLTLSNGLDWNLAGDTLYHIDTPTEKIHALDYDPDSGRVSNRRVFADLATAPGRPDGLTVDAEGGVWVAVARGGVVYRYADNGRLDAVIEMPVKTVTSVAFGGRDLDQLYVTTSRALLPEEQRETQPLAGHLLVVQDVGVKGRLPHRYGRQNGH